MLINFYGIFCIYMVHLSIFDEASLFMLYFSISYIDNSNERTILERLYRDYFGAMMQRVHTIVHDRSAAEDIVADAVLSLFDKAYKLDALSASECAAYMVRTAERQAFKYNKGAWRRKVTQLLEDAPDTVPSHAVIVEPEDLVLLHERRREIGAALHQLSERDQLLLDYRYYQNLSNREISKLMHIPEDNVKKYMYLARRRALPLLKEALCDENE